MTYPYYNNAENLTSTMIEFGKYTLKYEPPGETPEDHSVVMTISSEANIQQMLEFFSSFLRAAGYELNGDLTVDSPREPLVCEKHWDNFWEDDGISYTGNPYAAPDTISFGAAQFAGMWGGLKDDTITLG